MDESATPNVGADLIRIHKTITRGLAVAIEHSRAGGPPDEQNDGAVFVGY